MSYQTEEAFPILDNGVKTIAPKKEGGIKYHSIAILMVLCLALVSFGTGHSYGAANATTSMIKLQKDLIDLSNADCSNPETYKNIVGNYCFYHRWIYATDCFVGTIEAHQANLDGCPTYDPNDICNTQIKPVLQKLCLD